MDGGASCDLRVQLDRPARTQLTGRLPPPTALMPALGSTADLILWMKEMRAEIKKSNYSPNEHPAHEVGTIGGVYEIVS